MKKLKLSIAILMGILIMSCSSDDNNNATEESPIIGEWKLESISINGQNQNIDPCMLEQTQTFQTNGNLIEYFWEEMTPCTYGTASVQYTFENNILVSINEDDEINGEAFEITNEVTTLNETTLIYTETGDNFNGNYQDNERQTFTYSKVQ
jgi:hypothetical protein